MCSSLKRTPLQQELICFNRNLNGEIQKLASSMNVPNHGESKTRMTCSKMEVIQETPSNNKDVDFSYAMVTANSFYNCFQDYIDDMKSYHTVFLDIGAGIGNCCFVAAKFFPVKSVIGIEYNQSHKIQYDKTQEQLIKKFEKTQDVEKFQNIKYITGNACEHPELYRIATHCFSFNITWNHETVKKLASFICADNSSVDVLVWGFSPQQHKKYGINLIFEHAKFQFVKSQKIKMSGATNNNTTTMYIYIRKK